MLRVIVGLRVVNLIDEHGAPIGARSRRVKTRSTLDQFDLFPSSDTAMFGEELQRLTIAFPPTTDRCLRPNRKGRKQSPKPNNET